MAETNETPEAPESSGAEQKEPPVSPPPVSTDQPEVSTDQPEVSKDARNMAMLCHLLAIFTGFLGPLIIWLIKKDEDPFVDEHGKEALNFQITVFIAMFVSGILTMVCIGIFLAIVCLSDVSQSESLARSCALQYSAC